MTEPVLVLNAGSGTLKAALFRGDERLWSARLVWANTPAQLEVHSGVGEHRSDLELDGTARSVGAVVGQLWDGPAAVLERPSDVAAVGHRVVHGGRRRESALLDSSVRGDIEGAAVWAPSHNRAALAGIDAVADLLGDATPEVAVFDTAFHATIPDAAAVYPGPREWWDQGLRRYGFHGISHAQVARIVGSDRPRVVSAHLGGGCSVTAIAHGRSIDTTMGLTPMEGLMMATRSGTVDPGLLLHLLREGWTPEELASVLEERSGLHGLSGISASAQEVAEAAEGGDDSARLALGAYVHRVRAAVGAAAATLGGLDVLAFAGGVGEGAPVVRARVCDGLAHLGVELDVDRNEATTEGTVDVGVGAARVVVVDSDEELAVAREVRGTLSR